jgi:hypothetical protein
MPLAFTNPRTGSKIRFRPNRHPGAGVATEKVTQSLPFRWRAVVSSTLPPVV